MRCVITGGAGFIGSHLADSLLFQGHEATVIDDLSSGKREYVNEKASFIKKDIRKELTAEFQGADTIFHLAADPDVRSNSRDPKKSFDINVMGTISVLEACRKADVPRFVFASTSAVYGETDILPTPETAPCSPISEYGASKLACEAYASCYSALYGIRSTSFRLANIFGERSSHGVIPDFYNKLKDNPDQLEILGDGKQDKSYLHISDCISGMLAAWKTQQATYEVYNIGSKDKTTVDGIAQKISSYLSLHPKLIHTGTKRGWPGDVPLMLLDTKKLGSIGWRQQLSFDDGLKRYLEWLAA